MNPSPPPSSPMTSSSTAPASPSGSWLRQSIGVKVFVIAALVVLLLIPLALLQGLISERQRMRDGARAEVSAMWGGAQTVGGPVLSVPFTDTRTDGEGTSTTYQAGWAHFLPDELDIDATLVPEVRERDIFKVVLYKSDISLRGSFGVLDSDVQGLNGGVLQWERAVLSVGIPDLKGLKSEAVVTWAGSDYDAQSGLATNDVFGSGVSFPVDVNPEAASHAFALNLDLNGSQVLAFLPFGKTTTAHLSGAWGSPSFVGGFVTDTNTVTDTDFDARWRVLYLNRNYPQQFAGTLPGGEQRVRDYGYHDMMIEPASEGDVSAFGVRLLLPLDEYQKTMRTAEYGFLCLILTFVAIFFVEVLGKRRIHPLQYLLVGSAVALFYLLLLSFAEYVPFNAAYLLAMLAVLTLVLLYTRAIFRSWQYAGIVAGLLIVFYGYFFVLLQLEAYALLFGSLGLLVILALVMYLSRNVDWYSVGMKNDRDG